MVVAEAVALLFIGLFWGIMATMFDVLFVGAASFISHFSLWVLLNALIAIHVDSRTKAIWWALPFNLGYIESYFITTVASYESFSKSLIVPLALVAVISPLLTFGIWTAKREKNAYGQALSLLIVAGTLAASFVLNGTLSIYAVVVCLLLAFVLLKMPVHRLRISPSTRKPSEVQGVEQAMSAGVGSAREARPREASAGRFGSARESLRAKRRQRGENKEEKQSARRRLPLVRNTKDERARQGEGAQQNVSRERRRNSQVRPRRDKNQSLQPQGEPTVPNNGISTLGNARVARRSTRNSARYN